jgi:hypothetical protein
LLLAQTKIKHWAILFFMLLFFFIDAIDKNFLFAGGSIGNADLYVKKILAVRLAAALCLWKKSPLF